MQVQRGTVAVENANLQIAVNTPTKDINIARVVVNNHTHDHVNSGHEQILHLLTNQFNFRNLYLIKDYILTFD